MPMLSLTALLVFAGIYCLYASSVRKVAPNALGVEDRLLQQQALGRIAGSGFLLISLILAIVAEGVGTGIFTYSIILMTLGSLVVLLAPLGFINIRSLILFSALLLTIEAFL